jgi:hypothetical protein
LAVHISRDIGQPRAMSGNVEAALAFAVFGALLLLAAKGRPADWNARPFRWIPIGGFGWRSLSTKDRTQALAIVALGVAILELLGVWVK